MIKCFNEIKKHADKVDLDKLKTNVFATFVFGLIAHAFCFLNANFTHDCLNYSILDNDAKLELYLQLGRFLRPIYQLFKCSWELPWTNGLLSLLLISLSMYILNESLNINKRIYIIISCGIVVTCSSMSLLYATYLHDADSYALALLLMSIGMWISKNSNNRFIAIPLYVASLSLYQSYIQIAILIYLLDFINVLLSGGGVKDSKNALYNLALNALIIVSTMLIYYAIYRLTLFAFGFEESLAYNSVSKATDSIKETLIKRLLITYKSELKWFIYPNANKQTLIFVINIVLLIVVTYLLIKVIIKNKIEKSRIILIVFAVVAISFFINIISFLSIQSHALTLFPLYFFYVVILSLLQKADAFNIAYNKFYSSICLFFMFIMIIDNCIFSNKVYLQKELVVKNTMSIMTRLIDRIEQIDGYEVGKTKVVIIGTLDNSSFNYVRPDSIDYSTATGATYNFAITNYGSFINYFKYYMGYPINILSYEETLKYYDLDMIKQMDSFPQANSCVYIDDVLVIKLSD